MFTRRKAKKAAAIVESPLSEADTKKTLPYVQTIRGDIPGVTRWDQKAIQRDLESKGFPQDTPEMLFAHWRSQVVMGGGSRTLAENVATRGEDGRLVLGATAKAIVRGEGDPEKIYLVLKLLFNAADYDQSTELDKTELAEVMRAYYSLEGVSRSSAAAQKEVDAAVAKWDHDGNSLISLEEFVPMFCDISPDAAFKTKIPPAILRKVAKACVDEQLEQRVGYTTKYDTKLFNYTRLPHKLDKLESRTNG